MFTVRASTILSVIALMVTSGLTQGITNLVCFGDGLVGDCSPFINSFCTAPSIDSIPIFPQSRLAACFEDPAGFRCDFTAFRAQDTTGVLALDSTNCTNALLAAAEECAMGGTARVTGDDFFFTLDPNDGTCGDSTDPASLE
ncbi:hypothetical protein NM688_g987 [Phlebia brevispora]|uniref:Uncharacterized protein n=1 Tax=Phlebia brevispora TaxID=194682 RepID=A0ACC1TCY7_9APHY|nr:hypothetical protein NM688_g987 [Phlebia brevispora]